MSSDQTNRGSRADDRGEPDRPWVNRHTSIVVAAGAGLALLFLALALEVLAD